MRDLSVLPDRLRSKFRYSEDGCWEWTAGKSGSGYGIIQWPHPDGKKRKDGADPVAQAHRVVYHLLVDTSLPVYPTRRGDAKVQDHTCQNHGCVNPGHTMEETNRENCLRGLNSDLNPDKTSRHRGVHWDKANSKWVAQIQINGKATWLGRFSNEVDAANAYREASEGIAA